ncbi:hypothetical protein, partial [Bifidobacterium aesculapii]|uniref:hypothetical protein n=1 Tax=Bifidobacterium aesculapii TaxID=1329411 RepID=UPI001F2AEA15
MGVGVGWLCGVLFVVVCLLLVWLWCWVGVGGVGLVVFVVGFDTPVERRVFKGLRRVLSCRFACW